MIVWGGVDGSEQYFADGAAYDPVCDTWTPLPRVCDDLRPRAEHSAVWTGDRMVVWGGRDALDFFNDGGSYDPSSLPACPGPPQAEIVFGGVELTGDPDSVIYVLDNSASMSIKVQAFEDENGQIVSNGSKWDRVRALTKASLAALPERVLFNVVVYDECPMICFSTSRPANAANLAAAIGWLNAVQPDGWTNTGLGVSTALQERDNRQIVLVTDCLPNFLDCALQYVATPEQHAEVIQFANLQGARIDVFSLIACSPEGAAFCDRIAADSGGTHYED